MFAGWYIDSSGTTQYSSSSFTYDGSSKVVYPKDTNGAALAFYAGDSVTITYTGDSNSQINAGTYTTTVTLGTDLVSASYKLTGSTTLTNWVIAQRKIVLSWQGDTSATWSTQGSLLVVYI